MYRLTALVILAGIALANLGCIASVNYRGSLKIADRQAVVIDGDIYVVDLKKGDVSRIDPQAVAEAPILRQIEIETSED